MKPRSSSPPIFDRRPVFETPVVAIAHWRCRSSCRGPGAERAQPRPLIVLLRSGNFRVESSAEIGLLDCTRAGFFNANVPFRSAHPYSGGDTGADFGFRADALADVFGPFAADHPERPFRSGCGPLGAETFLLQTLVLKKAGSSSRDALEVEELSLRLLGKLAEPFRVGGAPGPRSLRREREEAEALRGFLSGHPGARHRLDDLARRLGTTPFRLCRSFRAATGTTIHRFLTDVRVNRAIDRLADGCRDLTDLAFDLGFSSHSHFTATFRRRVGVTPETVRRIARNEDASRLRERLTAAARK